MPYRTSLRHDLPQHYLRILSLGNRNFVTAPDVAGDLGVSVHQANVYLGDLIRCGYMRRPPIDGGRFFRATSAGEELVPA